MSIVPPSGFLLDEERSGYTVSALMKSVWAVQIDLFQELYRVCQQFNLKCWLDSGSLLGAIRHKGFIPWDDDIDLVMMRDDYEALKRLAPREFRHPYFFQCSSSEKDYFRMHAQFRNSETAGILPGDVWQDFDQGIFIDIFVLDGFDNEYWQSIRGRCADLRNRLWQRFYMRNSLRHPRQTIRRIPSLLHFWKNPPEAAFREVEDSFIRMNELDTDEVSYRWFADDVPILKREWYADTVMMDFEYISAPVPAGFDKILSRWYGDDYMTPRQAPSLHGSFAILDPRRSYREYIPILREQARRGISARVSNLLKSFR